VIIHHSLLNFLFAGVLSAQIKDTTVTVVTDFTPTIADAYKINDYPEVKDSVPPVPKLSYSINSKKVFTPFAVIPIKPAKMLGEPLQKIYHSLLKAGAGNYLYGEYFFNNLRSKEYSYGAHLKHLSFNGTIDGYGFSGFSDNRAEVYGKKFFRKHTLAGNLDYSRNVIHYYGYDIKAMQIKDNDLIKQIYNNTGGIASMQSHYTDSVKINYLLNLKYHNCTDFYKTTENNFLAEVAFSGFYEKQLIEVPLAVDFYNNKFDTLENNNSAVIRFSPNLLASGNKWNTRIGLGIAIDARENDNSRFLFYPNIDFNYNISNNIIIPYAGVGGGLKKNSLQSLTEENPFLLPNPDLENTSTKFELYAGLRGSISKSLTYNARTSYSKAENFHLFVNDNSDLVKKGFAVIYDTAAVWNVHGELQYQHMEKIKLIAKGEYNKYTNTEKKDGENWYAWHRPEFEFTLSGNYNLKNKIVAKADIFVFGKRFAYNTGQGQGPNISISASNIKELPMVIDGNLGLEYRYNKKLSGFLNLNNLGFKRYYLWNNYYSQKFNFMAGVTVGF